MNFTIENNNRDFRLPREKLMADGPEALTTEELLALILGKGIVGKNVFELAKDIKNFLEENSKKPNVEEICKIKGLGVAKACQILACLELSGRFLLASSQKTVCNPEDSVAYFSFMKYEVQEIFSVLTLNSKNGIIDTHVLTRGIVNNAPIHPREAFVKAIENRAVAVIFAHNHPSGSLIPSKEDLEITKILCNAGKLLGIQVFDHLIISPSGFTSIARLHSDFFE